MKYCLLLFLILVFNIARADEFPLPFWKNEYRLCYESADLIVIGYVTDLTPIDFIDGGNGYGYTHFNLTVDPDETVKGRSPGTFQYRVWYEGEKDFIPDIKGENSLFCLYIDDDGVIHDPEGFGRLPVNQELKEYIYSLRRDEDG